MKLKHLILTAFIISASAVSAQNAVKWDESAHNFGTFNEDIGKVTTIFSGINQKADTLYITDIRSTCGCTVPLVNSRAIAPGDSIKVTVTYDPTNRPGVFEKRVSVLFAHAGTEHLTISGKVKTSSKSMLANYPIECPHWRQQNRFIGIGNITLGATDSGNLFGINSQDMTITPQITGLPPHVTAVVYPDTVAEGERFMVNVVVDATDPNIPLDFNVDSAYISMKEFPGDSVAMPVTYIVRQDFSKLSSEEYADAPSPGLSTSSIDLGKIDLKKKKKPIRETVEVFNVGKTPMKIFRIYSYDKAITIHSDLTTIEPSKSGKFTIEINPAMLKGEDMLNARVTLVVNSPIDPTPSIRILGEVIDSSK